MSLAIDRLRARFNSRLPLPAALRDEWLAVLADADGDAVSAGLVASGEWLFIAHLPLAMRWSVDADAPTVGEQWQVQLRQAIEQALADDDDTQVIRYRGRAEALADLLYRSALGERRRQWAWQRMHLLEDVGVSGAQALAAGIAILVGEPQQVWPVLHRLLSAERETAALSALLRALPASAWASLFAASPRTAAYASAEQSVERGAATATATAAWSAAAFDSGLRSLLRASAEARDLLRWAAARGHFAARHLDPLSVMLAALVWSAAATPTATVRGRLFAARAELLAAIAIGDVAGTHRLARGAAQPAGEPVRAGEEGPAPAGPLAAIAEPEAVPALPESPGAIDWHGTDWGGALFWLARLAADGALEWLAEQPALPGDALPLLLRAAADGLGVPTDDPARAAFCGGQLPPGDTPPALDEYAAMLLAGWSAWLDEQAPELAPPRLQSVCRRRGRIRFEPGWIELLLPLDAVDTSIRRLGLDLDPGWLPWLACVLRIRYE